MIQFKHKLPSMNIDGKTNGTYNNIELEFPCIMTTTDYELGEFIHTLRNSIRAERRLVFIDHKIIMCNINWIRDHVHTMKAFCHWEYNVDSFLNFILDTQREDGQFYELIKQYDDRHWEMVNEDCRIMYPEDNLTLVRLELEADIEYLVVEGSVRLYQMTGDNEWLKKVLPKLEKAINYMTSDPKRWNPKYQLVMRPFTIDTWDFTYDPQNDSKWCGNRRIEKDTPMSIMHGDNSGVYQAMQQLAWLNRRLENEPQALTWEKRAETLRSNMIKYLWNGQFFIHQYHLNHSGADQSENIRLSLSNTYDINRKVTTLEQAQKIIQEYRSRKEQTSNFAEWFSIDPPYDNFDGYKTGEYVNGAISPFTAGELAKAALENGFEEYGWDIIARFMKLVKRDGAAYFLYYPDSTPQPQGGPSAWGAASFISAIDESLAGIKDLGTQYDTIGFSPRFPVTPYTELRYITGYERSSTLVDVRYIITKAGMRYDILSPAKQIQAHILLPVNCHCTSLYVNNKLQTYAVTHIGESEYIDFQISQSSPVSIQILF